jgi:hypothetical protein
MTLVRLIISKNPDAQSDDEIATTSLTRIKNVILSQLTNKMNIKEAVSLSKKRKNTSPLK